MRSTPLCLILLAGVLTLSAQPPLISHPGVVNAASYMPAGLPAGSIAQGSLFTIFGANLGPASSPSRLRKKADSAVTREQIASSMLYARR